MMVVTTTTRVMAMVTSCKTGVTRRRLSHLVELPEELFVLEVLAGLGR
jgi:hypothetical protein